jgi:hypothetical protein
MQNDDEGNNKSCSFDMDPNIMNLWLKGGGHKTREMVT